LSFVTVRPRFCAPVVAVRSDMWKNENTLHSFVVVTPSNYDLVLVKTWHSAETWYDLVPDER